MTKRSWDQDVPGLLNKLFALHPKEAVLIPFEKGARASPSRQSRRLPGGSGGDEDVGAQSPDARAAAGSLSASLSTGENSVEGCDSGDRGEEFVDKPSSVHKSKRPIWCGKLKDGQEMMWELHLWTAPFANSRDCTQTHLNEVHELMLMQNKNTSRVVGLAAIQALSKLDEMQTELVQSTNFGARGACNLHQLLLHFCVTNGQGG